MCHKLCGKQRTLRHFRFVKVDIEMLGYLQDKFSEFCPVSPEQISFYGTRFFESAIFTC